MVAPACRNGRLLRQKAGEILMAALCRRQEEDEDGETEGGKLGPLRSVTRRNHTHTQLNATRHSLGFDDDADLFKIDSSALADD